MLGATGRTMSPIPLTIDFKKRAEEMRAYARVLEEMGDLERAARLQEIADTFEKMATRERATRLQEIAEAFEEMATRRPRPKPPRLY
jgi:acyl carrier protein phosphodiesterase